MRHRFIIQTGTVQFANRCVQRHTNQLRVAKLTTTGNNNEKQQTEDVSVEPKMPEEWECCGNGCKDCVWDKYFKDYAQYTNQKQANNNRK